MMDSLWSPYITLTFALSLGVTLLLMPQLLKLCKRRGVYDIPDPRKVHHGNIPRLGGVLFIPATFVGTAGAMVLMGSLTGEAGEQPIFKQSVLLVLIGMFLLYLIGILDDLFGMRASVKFCIQIMVSLFLPFCGLHIHNLYGLFGLYEIPLWASYPLTVFISLLIVNAINLIDGIDGLAASLSLLDLVVFGFFFYRHEIYFYALFCAGLAGTVTAFLYFNLFGRQERNTKTFMGDTGSLTLGYALAFLAIRYVMTNAGCPPGDMHPTALLVPYTLLAIPCFDLVRVAFGRLRQRKSIFHPDKTHLHHKCLRAGFTMHQTLAMILLLQAGMGMFNWLLVTTGFGTPSVVCGDIALYAAFTGWLNLRYQHSFSANSDR